MISDKLMKAILWVGFVYDAVLGTAFLLAGSWAFEMLQITPPNHWAYLHLCAGFVVVLGVLQAMAALPAKPDRKLVLVCLMLKAVYCVVVFGHYALASIPGVWVLLGAVDAAFAFVFMLWFAGSPKPESE